MTDIREEVVILFSDQDVPKYIEISNGHTVMYRLSKVNREDRFRVLKELQADKVQKTT